MSDAPGPVPTPRPVDDELRVPFWIVLAGVGAGAFWALAGVALGSWLRGRGRPPQPPVRRGRWGRTARP
ncbi:hypothetical protein SAMN04488107_2844 [Geodermatophilus saharensis]|uniref:Uncharacterized protein n=1 Tax=Geodermatophilus saharensis TaxID=1137994 RepID=A0A239F4Q5_9ACTN|nr:hypothetical protein [Geodermatophilus saharensis]SNS52010.1 hypothetical protein SAMN04488107_2844 [Geodermatophilus saharensis]